MAKMLRSFRSKMIMLLGLSMVISATITFMIYKVLQLYYSTLKFENPLTPIRYFIRKIGDVNSFLIIFIPLAILFFFLLTKRYATYFSEISNGIHHLANGDFKSRVHISSNDEFGDVAKDINLASEKLQEAVERGDFAENSKDQLVLNLAHDLRTPLTSVLGYLDYILKDDHLTSEQVRHYTSIAFAKSQRLEKLIDELFEITRMNYGMLTIEKRQIDLTELLIQLNEELYPSFEKSHLVARLNVTPHLMIYGDGDLLARVFENLLTNAIRYGNDGQFVDINGYLDADDVVVQVVNYGDRIPPEELPHLFDMFYTGDQARTHRVGSTGLGLFITKNIVVQHNGTVSVQSSLIRTLFEVRLPRTDEISMKVKDVKGDQQVIRVETI
ncbi:HAMP domain-containing sensor histidine kinase [Paenibacillus sp. IHBB 10380]|uniref:HAMP domain-containing sensor histidine kinase n=1 Tax=Paenibacillus sp. IHBB 10380 TaxID=1566358 RepID=UPI0005CF9FE7|nr:HAMP domain-containing sensor histidine kinase [Paenibacillus sp. IHBB 10380]